MVSTPGTIRFPTDLDDADSLFRVANNADTRLTGSHNAAITTITVTSTAEAPASGAFSIDDEIIYYTAKTSTTLTGCLRGQEGTTAASHTNNAVVEWRLTAGMYAALRDAIIATETKLGSGSDTPVSGDVLKGTGTGASAWSALAIADTSGLQALLDAKATITALAAHTSDVANPHVVTKTQVGLSAVPNTDATARANHTGNQSADTLTDGTTNKAFLATERTKLSGIATAATANSADATLLARANHTGTQAASTIGSGTMALARMPNLATKVILAASDSPQIWKDAATVSGGLTVSSTNAAADIITAFATANHVELAPGTYLITEPITNVSATGAPILTGQGFDTLITVADGVAPTGSGHMIDFRGTSYAVPLVGAQVSNLRLQGYGDLKSVGTAVHNGVNFRYCDRGFVSYIWAKEVKFGVVTLSDCLNCQVDHVWAMRGTRGSTGGWYGVGCDAGVSSTAAERIAHHTFSNIIGDVPEHLIFTNRQRFVTFTNILGWNQIDDLAANFTTSEDIVLDGFIFENVHGGVFVEQTCTRNKISNGIITHSSTAATTYGVDIRTGTYTTVNNVHIVMTGQTGGHGIKVDATSDYSAIRGCTVYGAFDKGIYAEAAADNVEITGNIARNCGGNGIEVLGDYCNISGNHCELNTGHGIYFAGKYSEVIGNKSVSNTGDGIRLSFADDSIVFGNMSKSNFGYGINIQNVSCDRLVVRGNVVLSNTVGPIANSGSACLVADNAGMTTNPVSAALTDPGDGRPIYMTAGAADKTVTLRTAAISGAGYRLTVIRADAAAGNVIVDGAGSETINGALTKTLGAQYSAITIECTGTAWFIVSQLGTVT